MSQDTCRLRDSKLGCREDVHHRFFPRNRYMRGIAKVFRELEANKVLICRAEHDRIHATERDPKQPSALEMQEAVLLSRLAIKGEQNAQPEMGRGPLMVPTESGALGVEADIPRDDLGQYEKQAEDLPQENQGWIRNAATQTA